MGETPFYGSAGAGKTKAGRNDPGRCGRLDQSTSFSHTGEGLSHSANSVELVGSHAVLVFVQTGNLFFVGRPQAHADLDQGKHNAAAHEGPG